MALYIFTMTCQRSSPPKTRRLNLTRTVWAKTHGSWLGVNVFFRTWIIRASLLHLCYNLTLHQLGFSVYVWSHRWIIPAMKVPHVSKAITTFDLSIRMRTLFEHMCSLLAWTLLQSGFSELRSPSRPLPCYVGILSTAIHDSVAA